MAKIIVTTRRCPCCKYEYQQEDIYKDEYEPKKRFKSKKTGKVKDIEDAEYHFQRSRQFKKQILELYDEITEMVPKEIFDTSKVTKGDEDFKSVVTVSTEFSGVVGMFCPNCGVFLDSDICSTVSEKKL